MEILRNFGILIMYCAALFCASAQPSLPIEMLFPHQDKLIHLLAYAMMGLLVWRLFRHLVRKQSLLAWYTIGFCSLYGITDELHQSFVPGRSADPFDWVADTVGAVASVLLLLRRQTARTPP